MSSFISPARWLPAAIAQATVLAPPAGSRHSAPDASGLLDIVATDRVGPGRHAEPAWTREMFDASRDEDPFEWLGFGA